MQNLMKRCATIVVLATAAVAVVPMTAMADRVVVKRSAYGHGSKVKVVKQQRHRHAVGHRFRKQDVVIVKDWRKRGLPRPGRDEVYVANGDRIYLAAAATLLVRALLN
ncbi:RcnB family protein [Aliiroseovarius sediminis]|uniref:RcnB family protein n=1 Tax=Aliiroseovarius sediminis TaxID=2925839 RepID=UPI001F56FA8C|nr:RcnB family protein [Aliiroseovarius sediminis]MCI2393270.1 RcnB family protein [Aliiroseovarius sediminis]